MSRGRFFFLGPTSTTRDVGSRRDPRPKPRLANQRQGHGHLELLQQQASVPSTAVNPSRIQPKSATPPWATRENTGQSGRGIQMVCGDFSQLRKSCCGPSMQQTQNSAEGKLRKPPSCGCGAATLSMVSPNVTLQKAAGMFLPRAINKGGCRSVARPPVAMGGRSAYSHMVLVRTPGLFDYLTSVCFMRSNSKHKQTSRYTPPPQNLTVAFPSP